MYVLAIQPLVAPCSPHASSDSRLLQAHKVCDVLEKQKAEATSLAMEVCCKCSRPAMRYCEAVRGAHAVLTDSSCLTRPAPAAVRGFLLRRGCRESDGLLPCHAYGWQPSLASACGASTFEGCAMRDQGATPHSWSQRTALGEAHATAPADRRSALHPEGVCLCVVVRWWRRMLTVLTCGHCDTIGLESLEDPRHGQTWWCHLRPVLVPQEEEEAVRPEQENASQGQGDSEQETPGHRSIAQGCQGTRRASAAATGEKQVGTWHAVRLNASLRCQQNHTSIHSVFQCTITFLFVQ